jgi:hypothetical protein
MRLIPMLEIELNGTSMPLSLTVPSIDVAVRGPISATVHLEQNATDTTKTDLRFTFADKAQTYTVNIFEGACPASGTPLLSSALSVGDGATTTINPAGHRITILADGKHVLKLTGGGKTACQPIGNIINGPYSDKMVDTTPLQPYGISVREKNDAGALLVYIPLSVVADPTGGAAVAFSARMIYWPATADAWQQAQQVRVVWLVQMLTDQCDTTGFTPSAAAQADSSQYDAERQSWCRVHRTPDSTQVVQTYDTSASLSARSRGSSPASPCMRTWAWTSPSPGKIPPPTTILTPTTASGSSPAASSTRSSSAATRTTTTCLTSAWWPATPRTRPSRTASTPVAAYPTATTGAGASPCPPCASKRSPIPTGITSATSRRTTRRRS